MKKSNRETTQTEQHFLQEYDPQQFPPVAVAVDLLVFTIDEGVLKLLMVRREEMPFQGMLALPGVFVGIHETLDQAAARGIREEAGLENIYFEQLYTWGGLERDPRMRIISVSYLALVPVEKLSITAGSRVSEAMLIPVEDVLNGTIDTAFDHGSIISYARQRLKNKVEYTQIAFELVPTEFTLPQLQKVYEILLDKPLYKANFRKKIMPMVEEIDKFTAGDAHRPSRYYILKQRKNNKNK